MRIEIEIPKDFERHYIYDKFNDSLKRIRYDVFAGLTNAEDISCSHEYELVDMLVDAFKKSTEV